MLRRDRLIRMQVHQVLDACLIGVSFWLAFVLTMNPDVTDLLGQTPLNPQEYSTYVWLYLVLLPAAPMILEGQGFYNRPMLCNRPVSAWILLKSCLLMTLGLVMAMYLLRIDLPRRAIVWFGLISFGLMSVKEELLLQFFRSRLALSQYRRRFILAATGEEMDRLRARMKARPPEGIDICAELNLNEAPVQRLVELLHEHSASGVILSANRSYFDQVESAIRACELEGVEVWLMAAFFKPQISRTSLDDLHGQPMLVFRSAPDTSWQRMAKNVMDFLGALVLILMTSWLLALVAVLIKLTSPGPVLFRQQRSGLNGRPFTILKFRTMVTNAEQFQHELAAMNEMSGPVFKITKDPRITPVGKFLRKFSLDEFPQLFNVLRGEMSLVGPRPLPVDEVKRFNDLAHRRRLSVKPGLTCLWQISGRNNVKDFKDWVRLDLEYIDNWSLWLDIKILFQTIPVVLIGTGAR
jgi:exopolysaccharide biosynthesis polyprenyl glycosylphosphotransferase